MSIPDSAISDSGFPMKIGDQEYTASRFSDKDIGDLSEYIKSRYLHAAYEATKSLEETERNELRKIALGAVRNIGWGSPEGDEILFSDDGDGVLHIGYQMIRRRNPNVPYAAFQQEALKNLNESIDMIMLTFNQLHPKVQNAQAGGQQGAPAENDKRSI